MPDEYKHATLPLAFIAFFAAPPPLIACFEGILAPGTTETDIDKQIFHLTASKYGTRKHWHQRLPRIGMNTVNPIYEHVPDAVLKADDIVYVDLGPVFGGIEADFARTYVLGEPYSASGNLCQDNCTNFHVVL